MTHFGKRKFIGTNGVSMPERRKMTFRTDATKFIYIGRLEMHIKGLDLLLDAVKEKAELLREKHCTFDLYGPDILGRSAAVAELIEKNGIGDIVHLHPAISGKEKEDALLDADIFVQTSRSEGMPMGILEALSYGLPCLVTEGTTLANFVKEKDLGWACQTTVSEIGRALQDAIEEVDARSGKSIQTQNAIQASFAWEVVARESIEQYKRIVRH